MNALRYALAALALPVVLHAQQASPRTGFYLVAQTAGGVDTIMVEHATRTPASLAGEFVVRSGVRVRYRAELQPNGLVSRVQTRQFRNAGDTAGVSITITIGGDSAVMAVDGGPVLQRIKTDTSPLPLVNPSVAFMEQMTIRARALGCDRCTIPLFVGGAGQKTIPAVVARVGTDSATLDIAGVVTRLAVTADGQIRGGSIPAQHLTIVRGAVPATPDLEREAPERRDYSAPAGAPYTAEDVVVRTAAGLRLNGTLTMPRHAVGARVPAVVTITGSGPEDRDESPVNQLRGYRPFRELADTLSRRGVAVLRLDDRGVNGSDVGPSSVTSADFANDIRAAVAFVRARADVDPRRVGLVGHSEGGIVAPMVASTDSVLRAIVLMAAPASTGRAILLSQQQYFVDVQQHLTGAARDSALGSLQRATDAAAATMPWMKYFLDYDPSVVARRVRTPVLILQGENDHQVPVSEANTLAAAFRSGGNAHVTVRTFARVNHLFVADDIGGFSYEKLPSLHVRGDVLSTIADWLTTQFP